jgi:hypothetical protein
MTVGMAAAIPNRLFWCAAAGHASERSVPSAGTETRHLQMDSDVLSAEQGLLGFIPLRCSGQRGLERAPFAEPAEAAIVWSEPT